MASLAIDLLFVFDLVLKLRTFGRAYLQTPWFLIDLLSCLPILDVLANGVLPICARSGSSAGSASCRILRGLRVLRASATIPAFEQFMQGVPRRRENDRRSAPLDEHRRWSA